MKPAADNRAVSALFRLIGGRGDAGISETQVSSARVGMHRGEFRFLALLVPLTAYVAVGEWLAAVWGGVPGWMSAVPATFLLLNLLPWALGATGEKWQWRLWLGLLVCWGGFVGRHGGGIAQWLAYGWLVLAGLNAGAWFLLTLRSCNVLRAALLVALHLAALWVGYMWGWGFAVGMGALIAGAYCWAVLRPACQWLGPVRTQAEGREILITIDDGPDPRDTPLLLDLLDLHGTKAIFFMIGRKVAEHPELAREVLRRGHQIGNHTMNHPQGSFWCAGPWRTRREIAACQETIREATGFTPRWFRAPVGHRNWFTHPIAEEFGLEVMAWNRRGYDAVEKDPRRVLERILPDLAERDIVLVHEGTEIATEVLSGVLEGRPVTGLSSAGERRSGELAVLPTARSSRD